MTMNWTKTPPTKSGAYWWRDSARYESQLTSVFLLDGELFACLGDDRCRYRVNEAGGEWCGPLVPADDLSDAYDDGWRDGVKTGTWLHNLPAASRPERKPKPRDPVQTSHYAPSPAA